MRFVVFCLHNAHRTFGMRRMRSTQLAQNKWPHCSWRASDMCSRHIGHVIAVDRFSVSGSKAVKWCIAGDSKGWVRDVVRGGRGGGEGGGATRFAVGEDMVVATGRS